MLTLLTVIAWPASLAGLLFFLARAHGNERRAWNVERSRYEATISELKQQKAKLRQQIKALQSTDHISPDDDSLIDRVRSQDEWNGS